MSTEKMLTHVTFRITGPENQLPAFDARLKVLLAEHEVTGDFAEQHSNDTLHYDMKVVTGIPFPPFALASAEIPAVTVTVDWFNAGTLERGTARIANGMLAEQNVEATARAQGHAGIAIMLAADGSVKLALSATRSGRDEWRGYTLTAKEDALFLVARDSAADSIELLATQGAAEWQRSWKIVSDNIQYQDLDPARPLADRDFRELETLAQEFVAQWMWFSNGPREEIAIEIERYRRIGHVISDANLRSSALHRIQAHDNSAVNYSTFDAKSNWVVAALERCWPVIN